MCLICNVGTDLATPFQEEFELAQFHLKNAKKQLLNISKKDRRYDAKYKQLLKLTKELNRWYSEEREKHES